MFGAVTRYLFEYILGIRQKEGSAGFTEIVIEPRCMKQIPVARGHITTEVGVICVSYDREGIRAEVPEGVRGELRAFGKTVELSAGELLISGEAAD